MTLKVVYRNGAFVPAGACRVAEGTEAIVVLPRAETRPADTQSVLARLVEEMRNNPLPVNGPRFTREQLHERG